MATLLLGSPRRLIAVFADGICACATLPCGLSTRRPVARCSVLCHRLPPLCCSCGSISRREMATNHNGSPPPTKQTPDVIEFLDGLKNYEKIGVPRGAGTDSTEGFNLDRMRRLLLRLGDPLSHYPVVHIAGTKGKGSTSAFISHILCAQGYSVGSYTSPHIQTLHERISAGKTLEPISKTAFQKLFQENWEIIETAIAAEQGLLSHFEVLTALAFKYFAQMNVDIAVIEAGLGGARDATNVILPEGLAAAVITNVGKEHLAALGGTLQSIALAKSGIIKAGRPVVLGGPLDVDIEKIICEVAAVKNARVVRAFGQAMYCTVNEVKVEGECAFQYCDISVEKDLSNDKTCKEKLEGSIRLRMIGQHQLNNAVTAISTILCLQDQGWAVQEDAIWSGLKEAFIPGRFQIIPNSEALKLGCVHSTLVLDGAHTTGSAKALADTLSMAFPKEPLAFVIAMASDKDHFGYALQLLSCAKPKLVVVTQTSVAGGHMRSTSSQILAEVWHQAAREQGLEVQVLEGAPETQLSVGSCDINIGFWENRCLSKNKYTWPESPFVIAESNTILEGIQYANKLLQDDHRKGVICVSGSLHAVSAVLSSVT